MKKKMISVALAAILAFSTVALSGCGSSSSSSDVEDIKKNGKLVVGITDFAPMDYKEEGSDDWVGFDADLARKVGEDLGVDVEFKEIDWDNKLLELKNKSIDVVWNGMTLTDEVKTSMECTKSYCGNAQTVVLPKDKAEEYKDVDSLKDLTLAVEAGSAGEAAAKDNGLNYTAMQSQADTLMEVQAGTSDGAIIDLLMAGAMIGEGTSYPDLTHTLELTTEQYVVGCRKGSDLASYINDEFDKFNKDGSLMELASKYGVQDAVITDSTSEASSTNS
ncbi:MAG: transporter substrate-binding domain-containing protein [Lachnospiraceae bacterium]|nr:transporter substrate-binding domain-containing protein [Lachnospiraceae bacterium]